MTRPLEKLAGLLSALAIGTAPALAQDQAVTRSLRAFWPPAVQLTEPQVSAIPDEETTARGGHQTTEIDIDLDWLDELLTARHEAAIDAGQLLLVRDGSDRMTLAGERGAVTAAAADLDRLIAAFSRTIVLTAERLPLTGDELPGTVLDRDQLAALRANAKPSWSAETRLATGGTARLGKDRWLGYLRDVDVEVAEKARMDDPKMDLLFGGTSVVATVHALTEERLLLHGSWLVSETIELRRSNTGPDDSHVELPHTHTAAISFSGALDAGDALVVAARSDAPDGLRLALVLTARYATPRPTPGAGMTVLPTTAFRAPITWPKLPKPGPLPFHEYPQHTAAPDRTLLSPPQLDELLTATVARSSELASHNGFLVLHGDPADCAGAERLLRMLTAAQTGNATLRVERDGGAHGPAMALVMPSLPDVPSYAFFGTERSLIGDAEIELASGVGQPNPRIITMRSGIWSECLFAEADDGGVQMRGTWCSADHGATRSFTLQTMHPIQLEATERHESVWPWNGRMQSGATHSLSPGFRIRLQQN